MPKFRITAYAEWFFAESIEADSTAHAQEQLLEKIRDGSVTPVAGPGVTFSNHRLLGEDVTPEQDPR